MILFIVSFVAGILTILAPCVLPLLPVTLGGTMAEAGNRRRPFVIIGSLAASVFVFTLILKGSTALIGASPTFWSYISAAILTAFGLTLLFPNAWARVVLKLPGHGKPDSWMAKGYQHRAAWWGDILLGAALGPVFTTCSPTFFVILATVLPQSISMGIVDLLAYIVGLSLSLLLVAWLGQKLVGKLGWAADPEGWFRKVLGAIFIVVAVAIVFGWDKQVEADILNSGFFDVTTVEQSFHQALQGSVTSNGQGNAPAAGDEGPYIEIADPAGFINTSSTSPAYSAGPPITIGQFIGKKVVLIDFIDYSCINCERTFPYLEEWWNKYKNQGLEVIAIHTPEFAFEKDISNVEAAAKQFGLTFPIVLDNDYATWNAYKNEYWPHKYLIDANGRIVYDHIGEGGYDETEAEIVKQLNILHQKLGEPADVTVGTSSLPGNYIVETNSPETYFGSARNEYFGNGVPGVSGIQTFTGPDTSETLTPDEFYLGGSWNIHGQYAQNTTASATLSYVFDAAKMNLVAGTTNGQPVTATVLIDGAPIPAVWQGSDVKDGVLTITSSRLYNIFSSSMMGQHRIDIIFNQPGAQVYTFTFG